MDLRATPRNRSLIGWWLATFVAALVLYLFTASHEPGWQDAGWQQLRILQKQVNHPLGLALVHPLHHYLGRASVYVLSSVEPAFAITLVSALAGAIAIANVACIVLAMTRKTSAALVACTSLLVSHTLWQHSTHTESYALTVALLSGEWLFLALFSLSGRAGYLLAVLALNGLGISNHLLATLATPFDFLVLLLAWRGRGLRGSQAFLAILLWIVGVAPYLTLIAITMADTGDIAATIRSAIFGSFAPAVLNTSVGTGMLLKSAGYILFNFPNFTLVLALVGIRHRQVLFNANRDVNWPSLFFKVLLGELALYAIFVIRYAIIDQYTFFAPLYAIIAVFCGFGAASLGPKHRATWIVAALLLNLATPGVYFLVSRTLAARGALPAVEGKPYRDGYRALLIPWGRGDDHAGRLNDAAISLAGPNGLIVVVDPMIGFGLDYLSVLKRIPEGVSIRSIATFSPERAAPVRQAMAQALHAGRPVVLVPGQRDQDTYFADTVWERHGDLYLLRSIKNQ